MKTKNLKLNITRCSILLAMLLSFSSCENLFEGKEPDKFVVSVSEDITTPGSEMSYSVEGCDFAFKYAPAESIKKAVGGSASNIWMGKTEVTYRLWKEIYDWGIENGYVFDSEGDCGSKDEGLSDLHPVANVCWYDAVVWSNALTEYYNLYNGDKPDYDFCYLANGEPVKNAEIDNPDFDIISFDEEALGFRIPIQKEWLAAASYKNLPDDYPSGATDTYENEQACDAVSWHRYNSDEHTHEVATRLPNTLGIFDMSGNVSEIIYDPFERYGGKWGIKGGAWNSNLLELSIGESHPVMRHTKSGAVGFRLCRLLTEETHEDIEEVEIEEDNSTVESSGSGTLTLNGTEYEISKALLHNFNSIGAGYYQLIFLSEDIELNDENSGGFEGTGNMVHILIATDEEALYEKTYTEESYMMIDVTANLNCNTDHFPWASDIDFLGYNQETMTVEIDGDEYTIDFSCNGSADGGDTQTILSGTYTGTVFQMNAGFDM